MEWPLHSIAMEQHYLLLVPSCGMTLPKLVAFAFMLG